MDDRHILCENKKGIVVADDVCRAFGEDSGAIFIRNRQAVCLHLISWEGIQAWMATSVAAGCPAGPSVWVHGGSPICRHPEIS